MANVVYADPFGSYVKGQQAGNETAIRTGMAARQFRAEDLNPAVQKWYLPMKQQEMENELQKSGIDVNSALGKQLAAGLISGAPEAQQQFNDFLQRTRGYTVDFSKYSDPRQALIATNMSQGNIGAGLLYPNATFSGTNGTGLAVQANQGQQGDPEIQDLERQVYKQRLQGQLQPQQVGSTGNPLIDGLKGFYTPPPAAPKAPAAPTAPASPYGTPQGNMNVNAVPFGASPAQAPPPKTFATHPWADEHPAAPPVTSPTVSSNGNAAQTQGGG